MKNKEKTINNKKVAIISLLLIVLIIGTFCFAGCMLQVTPKRGYTTKVDGLEQQTNAANVANYAATSVVKVYCEWSSSRAAGAGFVINKNGSVITNAHCILKGNDVTIDSRAKVSVEFIDGTVLSMNVVDYDPKLDIALLVPKNAVKECDFLKFADSANLTFGQEAFTFGNPEDVGLLFSSAMISNPNLGIEHDGVGNIIQRAIVLDSTINHGNSGGALLDKNGDVIGVVFARLESLGKDVNEMYGVGCAIHSNDVTKYLDDAAALGKVKEAAYTKVTSAA